MARENRSEIFDPMEVTVVHCIQRAVRRAMLCGLDPLTGRSFEHRRQWVEERLEQLAGVFGIDVLGYAIMGNHLHVVVRNRPDVVGTWSDREVAVRWWQLFPQRREADGGAAEPRESDLGRVLNDSRRLAECRRRLSDISWFMRCLAEVIARRANREDECTGRFWEGRFKSQVLADESALLACLAYVDLNPIRAGLAETPEESRYTSVHERIRSERLAVRRAARGRGKEPRRGATAGRRRAVLADGGRPDDWLAPVGLAEPRGAGPQPGRSGRRASDKGFLPISLHQYLQLVDWTGRQLRQGKRGAIPRQLAPILERIGLAGPTWCQLVASFGKLFRRVAGRRQTLAQEAARRKQRWLQAPGAALMAT